MAIDRDEEGLRVKSNARMKKEKLKTDDHKAEVEQVLAERGKSNANKVKPTR
jgi:hypothetical protein